VDIKERAIGDGITLPLGGLRLHDMAKGLLPAAERIAKTELARAKFLKQGKGRIFYAVGGTWRNLARLHMNATNYPLGVMHHYEMDVEKSAGFDPGRQRRHRQDFRHRGGLEEPTCVACLWRTGAAADHRDDEAVKDRGLGSRRAGRFPLFAAAAQRAKRRSAAFGGGRTFRPAVPFGRSRPRTCRLDEEILQAFGIDETEDEARYREATCLLADIGWRAHPEYRGTQSLNIIAHASLIGVDPGRAYIALANLYRHEGIFAEVAVGEALKRLAPQRYIERARFLAALFRVGYMLSAAMPGVIPRLKWKSAGWTRWR
jgi:exopolyphosphatase/guanosine-5'-triphosphate,3'-diphosphate pyrophosphatase